MDTPRKRKRWPIVVAVVAVLVGLGAWRGYSVVSGAGRHALAGHQSLVVDAIRVTRQPIPLLLHAAGVVQTSHSVSVRAQVGGILEKVRFHEGDEVKAGQLLFVIAPGPYKAAVAAAEGQVEQDKAKLKADRSSYQRMLKLGKNGYVSAQDKQNAQAQVQQDEGLLAMHRAELDKAKLDLDHTRISAPISGRTSDITYKTGNLIQANDSTALVTINRISPILVKFDIPQSALRSLFRYRTNPALNIFVRSPNGQLVASGGKLVFIDNALNQGSGTLALKAKFDNQGESLWPGELVQVGMQMAIEHNRVAVPVAAIQPGQQGDYVFVIRNGKAAVQSVHVARHYRGYAIVSKGLDTGDEVAVHIPRDLREGLAVKANFLPDVVIAANAASASGGMRSGVRAIAPPQTGS
jgi:multidrug efflux system membrane fusion protein